MVTTVLCNILFACMRSMTGTQFTDKTMENQEFVQDHTRVSVADPTLEPHPPHRAEVEGIRTGWGWSERLGARGEPKDTGRLEWGLQLKRWIEPDN